MSQSPPLLEVRSLSVDYRRGHRRGDTVRVLDGVDLSIRPGETVGLVGESGSGKSTLARAVLGLAPVSEGSINFLGQDLVSRRGSDRRRLSADLQVVFQDPYSSLNPSKTIASTLVEPLLVQGGMDRRDRASRVGDALERVGLPASTGQKYPSELSGGQRQRVAIARALMRSPRLVICDEPVSALDLSVQAQVMNLLGEIQASLGCAYLFIAHDLSVVRHLSQQIYVLYQGRVVESGPAAEVYDQPRHPYTQALLAASRPQREAPGAEAVTAGPPDQGGCRFAPRCPYAVDRCHEVAPELRPFGTEVSVACLRVGELAAAAAGR